MSVYFMLWILLASVNNGLVTAWSSNEVQASKSQEFCQWEVFRASCSSNQVILMTLARYGRMKVSRCVPIDYYVGCAADVLDSVDSRCSGRQNCTIAIPDLELVKLQPCRKDLVAYFEAAYRCVTVVGPPQDSSCSSSPPSTLNSLPTLNSLSGYITNQPIISSASTSPISSPPSSSRSIALHRPPPSSSSPSLFSSFISSSSSSSPSLHSPSSSSSAASSNDRCSWAITVEEGQRINVTLYDFTGASKVQQQHNSAKHQQHHRHLANAAGETSSCPLVAVFDEPDVPEFNLRSCRLARHGKRVVYTSRGNRLRVSIIRKAASTGGSIHQPDVYFPDQIFLFHYQAIGCADLVTPAHAQSVRRGDTTIVWCNRTTEKWHLVCKTNEWIGAQINCTGGNDVTVQVGPLENLETAHLSQPHTPLGLLVAVTLGATVGIVTGCFFLLLVFVGRKKIHRPPTSTQKSAAAAAQQRLSSSKPVTYGDVGNIYKLIETGTIYPPSGVIFDDVTTTSRDVKSRDVKARDGVTQCTCTYSRVGGLPENQLTEYTLPCLHDDDDDDDDDDEDENDEVTNATRNDDVRTEAPLLLASQRNDEETKKRNYCRPNSNCGQRQNGYNVFIMDCYRTPADVVSETQQELRVDRFEPWVRNGVGRGAAVGDGVGETVSRSGSGETTASAPHSLRRLAKPPPPPPKTFRGGYDDGVVPFSTLRDVKTAPHDVMTTSHDVVTTPRDVLMTSSTASTRQDVQRGGGGSGKKVCRAREKQIATDAAISSTNRSDMTLR